MKRMLSLLLSLLLFVSFAVTGMGETAGRENNASAVYQMIVAHTALTPEAKDGIELWREFWFNDEGLANTDLSEAPGLAYSLSFSEKTKFPAREKLPAGYDSKALLEWGKGLSLNVDILHAHGFTGKGVAVAYADQAVAPHEQFQLDENHYVNNSKEDYSMHGPTVISMLNGKDFGTAPDAELYYYAYPSAEENMANLAQCLYQIMEKNESLPEGKKIRMVGFSNNIRPDVPNNDQLVEAVKACEEAGIMVWFCGDYAAAAFIPFSDRNNFNNLYPDPRYGMYAPELVHVPSSGVTGAYNDQKNSYIYWAQGGLSWTMPYMLGLYTTALQVDPSLTKEEIRRLVVETAFENAQGIRIVDPLNFICAVLRQVGREAEAEEMLSEAAARTRFLYAVMDTARMTEDDLKAIGKYLGSITDCIPLIADASSFADAPALYAALREDAEKRGGTVAGIQIFGTPEMVPSFGVEYKVDMGENGIHQGGTMLTDLFYGNFRNEPESLKTEWSVMDDLADGAMDRVLMPEWPTARLPLSRGEYAAFFEKYDAFVLSTGLEQLEIVNFSNPIFADKNSTDNFGEFMKRAETEFKIIDKACRYYGNQKGEYPVSYAVLGGFEKKNLKKENQNGILEFIINSHGQRDNIDNAWFEKGEEKRESLVNMKNINEVFSGFPYYLDCWTCSNGYGMEKNLTTTALNGKCVGMFSATEIISNNGVDCFASLKNMAHTNFYYFYYHYLKALHEKSSRSEAFFTAQSEYAASLLKDVENREAERESNAIQFNLYNLLVYHNFGVLEPNAAATAVCDTVGVISQSGNSVEKIRLIQNGSGGVGASGNLVSEGNPVGKDRSASFKIQNNNSNTCNLKIKSIKVQALDNGQDRYTVCYTAQPGLNVCIFNPPDGDKVKLFASGPSDDQERELVFDLDPEKLEGVAEVVINFYFSDNDRIFVTLKRK